MCQRTWTTTGVKEVPPENRPSVERTIKALTWQGLPCEAGMMPGLGIKACIKELRLPKVSHVAISHELAPYGFYGIRAHYKNGTAEVFVMDTGTMLVPILSDFHPAGKEF